MKNAWRSYAKPCSRKHLLMQKPMAHSLAAAREMVELAERHGVLLAVNQNARWSPQYRAARLAIEAGLLGEVYLLVHEMQSTQDSQEWFQQRWLHSRIASRSWNMLSTTWT